MDANQRLLEPGIEPGSRGVIISEVTPCSMLVSEVLNHYPTLQLHDICPICQIKIGYHKEKSNLGNVNYVGYQTYAIPNINVPLCSFCPSIAINKCRDCSQNLCISHVDSMARPNCSTGPCKDTQMCRRYVIWGVFLAFFISLATFIAVKFS